MYVDIIVVSLLLIYIISGYRMGFFVEFISMFGLIGNFYLAKYMTPITMGLLDLKIEADNYLVVYVAVFISLYLVLMLLTGILNSFFKSQQKGIMTRIGGIIISGIKGGLVILVLLTGYRFLLKKNPKYEKFGEKSVVLANYDEIITTLYDYVPEELKIKIDEVKKSRIVDQYIKKIF